MSEVFKEKSFEDLYKELCNLPENVVGEILNGELIVSPRPAPKHSRASSILGGVIGGPYDRGQGGPGGWWILDEPEVHLIEQVIVPDIAGWKKERMPKLPEAAYFDLRPDWVCEVVSPSSARHDRVTKMSLYAEMEVPYYWLVDPNQRVLEVYELQNSNWMRKASFADDSKVSAPPFEAIEFDLGDLWAD